MAGAILSVLAALIIFFVLTESLTINLEYGENYTVKFNFMVFAIIFKSSKSHTFKKKKQKKRKKFKKRFFYRLLAILLPRSSVKIHCLILSIPESLPKADAISYGIYSAIISSFVAFLENTSKFFEASNITILYSEHNKIKKQLEAELKISLLDFLISLISFFFSEIYYRLFAKRMLKNNE